ncbi:BtpA/SgcQ family protein [Proteiniclasticum sp. SCR006]|uniref:BtpA/SgcQ family protein n=1 Tax=Proteiniclasticum aestuarii TaxID=2817862 RepID=A0A939HAW7_9CLOT|nr:BtpA/SgcQ family protein [Proteiniclasticum aestuarii]MBO1265098.1 BtpA/SgcQ family protein [Proteiniclasticum aestuarii]
MKKLDFNKKPIIGMVHCLPLPGTMKFKDNLPEITTQAIHDAKTLEKAGVDAIIIENMGDDPFGVKLDIAQVTALSAISALVAKEVSLPIGIDAAMNDYETSLSLAKAIDADFVRIPVFVDTVEFYGGIINPVAREATLFRKQINAEDILIFADIQVKHTHMVLSSVSIEDSARSAMDCGADAIIVTGTHIGVETPMEIIKKVKSIANIPVIIGSGVKAMNIKSQLDLADGAIVGSSMKEGGIISNPISYKLARDVVEARNKESEA